MVHSFYAIYTTLSFINVSLNYTEDMLVVEWHSYCLHMHIHIFP